MRSSKNNLRSLFLFNGLLLLVTFILIQYSVVQSESVQPVQVKPILQGDFVRQFELYNQPESVPPFTFKTVFGKDKTLEDFKGQWVFVNFWATWCAPCIKEMPSLQTMQNTYEDRNVTVLAIAVDRNMDGQKLMQFTRRYNFGPIASYYADNATMMRLFGLRGLPTTYVIAPDGRAIGHYLADTDWAGEDATVFVESLLAAQSISME